MGLFKKNGKPKRISKRRDPWYNKYLHFGKRVAAGASGAALGYIWKNTPGAAAGGSAAWNYVGKYKRPYKAHLSSNPRKITGSNPQRRKVTGSNPYRGPILGSNPPNSGKTGSNRGPVLGSNRPTTKSSSIKQTPNFRRRARHQHNFSKTHYIKRIY